MKVKGRVGPEGMGVRELAFAVLLCCREGMAGPGQDPEDWGYDPASDEVEVGRGSFLRRAKVECELEETMRRLGRVGAATALELLGRALARFGRVDYLLGTLMRIKGGRCPHALDHALAGDGASGTHSDEAACARDQADAALSFWKDGEV